LILKGKILKKQFIKNSIHPPLGFCPNTKTFRCAIPTRLFYFIEEFLKLIEIILFTHLSLESSKNLLFYISLNNLNFLKLSSTSLLCLMN